MDLLIHVGLHKTGTTTVQDCLYRSRNKLLDAGILYPSTALFGSQHALLPGCLIPQHFYLDRISRSLDLSHYLQLLEKEVRAHNPELVVLSSEVFSEITSLRLPCIDLLTKLGSNFRSTHLLVTLRNPEQLALSALKHSVRDRIGSWMVNPIGSYIRAVQSTNSIRLFWKSLDLACTFKHLEGAESELARHYFGEIFGRYATDEYSFVETNQNGGCPVDHGQLNADTLPASTYMTLFMLGNTHRSNLLARRRIFSEIAKASDSSHNYRELRAAVKSEHLIAYLEYFKVKSERGEALDLGSISLEEKRKALEMTDLSSDRIDAIAELVAKLTLPGE